MDNYITDLLKLNKINENTIKIEELREMIEVSNMKINELKTLIRQQEYLINKSLNYKYYNINQNNYYGLYIINSIYMCFFIYIFNKL